MLEEARELVGWSKECEALSIYHELSKLEDTRGKQGKRYTLALLLTCVLLAKLAGETTLQAITEWIRLRSNWLQEVLPETRGTFPCAATYSNVLRTVDPAQVNQVLMDVLTRARAQKRLPEDQTHVVLDGKTLRGTLHHLAEDQRPMHHMALYEAKTGIVLKEAMVAEHANELTHMNLFLTPVLLQGRIISADALYTPHSFCDSGACRGSRLPVGGQAQSTHLI
jgi:DDE_Tnp_1-associated